MKTQTLHLTLMTVVFLMLTGTTLFAQTNYGNGFTTTQVVRNNNDVQYTVSNPDGASATFTWTVTGGTIIVGGVAQASPYNQVGTASPTVSIYVRWDNTNKTTTNNGTLTVSKAVGTCVSSTSQTFSVQSWVAPLANVTTTSFSVCSATASSVNVNFEGNAGNSGYLYKWRVIKVSDNSVVEDHTASFTSSATPAISVNIAAIANSTSAAVSYRFEITQMQDGFTDIANGDVSSANVTFTVNPDPTVGPISSSNSLSLR